MTDVAPVLAAEGLTLRYGSVTALDSVTFSVRDDEVLAVIGPNGAGKTSLFDVLCCVVTPSAGRVRARGRDLARMRPSHLAALGIARTLQTPGLFSGLSVLENVLVGRHHLMARGTLRGGLHMRTAAGERRHRDAAMSALELCGVARYAGARVATLPYGVQKRVELARALASEPALLLLDEPLAGLSANERAGIVALLAQLRARHDMAMVLVEHDMGAVMQVADSVLVLDFGTVVTIGPPASVQRDDRVIRAYLGEPAGAEAGA